MYKLKKISKPLGIVLLIFVIAIIVFLINGLFVNQEFGLFINLYKTRGCAHIEESKWDYSDTCFIYGHSISTNLFNPTSLEDGLGYILNIFPENKKLKDFSKNPSDWNCATNDKIVESNKKERVWSIKQIVYKCWPVENK